MTDVFFLKNFIFWSVSCLNRGTAIKTNISMKKLSIWLVVFFIGYWFASPYWVTYQIEQAVKNNNAEKLSSYIDFKALKQNLKAQLEQEMQSRLGAKNDPQVAAFAQMFASAFVDKVLDSMVSPQGMTMLIQGMTMLIQGKKAYENNAVSFQSQHHADQTNAQKTADKVEPDYSGQYENLNRFGITQTTKTGQKAGFILTRDGLSWKMTEILMPEQPADSN